MRPLILLPLAALTIAAAPVASPQVAIRAAMDASAAGWNAGDLARFVAIYGRDATFVTPKGLVQGRDAIAEHYRASFTGGGNTRGKLSFELMAFRTIDPVHQLLFARWKLTPDGGVAGDSGMTTLLFERQPAGWKIVADHSS